MSRFWFILRAHACILNLNGTRCKSPIEHQDTFNQGFANGGELYLALVLFHFLSAPTEHLSFSPLRAKPLISAGNLDEGLMDGIRANESVRPHEQLH